MAHQTKETAVNWVTENLSILSAWNQIIWDYAEPSWREYKSSAWYVDLLREEGFEVEAGSGGMPTAFCATWRNGRGGPVIGSYAEYDAVPGNCQKATTYQAPRDGLSPYAPGHTDPHSALGMAQLGGVLAAKHAMETHGIPGTIKFFGEPAEKVRGSKPIHAAKGYYDGVDAFLSFHPTWMYPHVNTTVWDTHCGAGFAKIYTFTCDDPHSWITVPSDNVFPVAHSGARAPGANDALMLMYQLSRQLQSNMLPFSTSWSISEAILIAGQASADNLPHHISQIQYLWRTPTVEEAETIGRILDQTADHVAKITHTNVTKNWVSRSRPGLANHVMAEATFENVKWIGPPQWGEEAKAIAREIQANIGYEPMDEPFVPLTEELLEPQEAERILRQGLPPMQQNYTSDDYTEYTWHAPTVRLIMARPILNAPPGVANPDWATVAIGGIPACIDPMIDVSAKILGATIMDLLTKPDLLARAWEEFNERTGGVGGERWIPPLLPPDFDPPVHFRWPEYVTTARGEEWWIPA